MAIWITLSKGDELEHGEKQSPNTDCHYFLLILAYPRNQRASHYICRALQIFARKPQEVKSLETTPPPTKKLHMAWNHEFACWFCFGCHVVCVCSFICKAFYAIWPCWYSIFWECILTTIWGGGDYHGFQEPTELQISAHAMSSGVCPLKDRLTYTPFFNYYIHVLVLQID